VSGLLIQNREIRQSELLQADKRAQRTEVSFGGNYFNKIRS